MKNCNKVDDELIRLVSSLSNKLFYGLMNDQLRTKLINVFLLRDDSHVSILNELKRNLENE